jgi:RNA polymerase sigma-70 factor (ECF subfamily)
MEVTVDHFVASAPEMSQRLPEFDVIYEAHFDFVWRALLRLGVGAQVEDAVQDVFLVVHRRRDTFAARSTLKTWIYGIALRVARDYRRRQRRKGGLTSLATEPEATSGDPYLSAEQRQAAALLREALSTLDDDQREVFVLAELEQLTVPEIAQAVGIKLNTAYSRLRLARAAVERRLRRYQTELSGSSP